MLHNGAGTSGGQDSGSSSKDHKKLHRLVEEPPEFYRSQIKSTTGDISSRASQCIITKVMQMKVFMKLFIHLNCSTTDFSYRL